MIKQSVRLYYWAFGWPFDAGVCIIMVALGTALMIWPDKGLAGYIQNTLGLPMQWYGVITIGCGFELLYHPSALRFAIFSTPIAFYAVMSIPYFIWGLYTQGGTTGTTIVVAWMGLYWLMGYVNTRRARLLVSNVAL